MIVDKKFLMIMTENVSLKMSYIDVLVNAGENSADPYNSKDKFPV